MPRGRGRRVPSTRDREQATPPAPSTQTADLINTPELSALINNAVREAVAQASEEFRRGRSVDHEHNQWEAGSDARLGRGASPGFISAPHPTGDPLSGSAGNVSASIRQKIVSHKYVDLKMLLLPNERPSGNDERQYLVAEGGRIALGPTPRTDDLSVNGWVKGFLRYANIYIADYPEEARSILGYMSTVMDLTRKGLGTAWRDYDESFRKAREMSPEEYPWDRPPQMLWMGAVASGVAAFRGEDRSGGDGRAQLKRKLALPAPNPSRKCFAFNSHSGCTWQACRYKHACSICDGHHSAEACRGGPAGRGRPGNGGPAR